MKIKYKLLYGSYFEIDGSRSESFETDGELEYILHWLRDKLRKFENAEIKVFKYSNHQRDWEEEEKIKRHLWENIRTTQVAIRANNEVAMVALSYLPSSYGTNTIVCYQELQTHQPPYRPPSPTCKIS